MATNPNNPLAGRTALIIGGMCGIGVAAMVQAQAANATVAWSDPARSAQVGGRWNSEGVV